MELQDNESSIEVRWTLELRVVDQELRAVGGASVTVNDTLGQVAFTGQTDPQGIARAELVDYTRTRLATDSGTSATRRSPWAISLGTAIFNNSDSAITRSSFNFFSIAAKSSVFFAIIFFILS